MSEPTSTENKLSILGRGSLGKNASFRIRSEGNVPAIVYGPKLKQGIAVSISPKEVRSLYSRVGRTGLVTLEAGEGAPKELNGTKALFKEIQSHPLKRNIVHVDLHQLDLTKKIRVIVPLNFVGKAKGLAEGGIMSIVTRQVEIKCLPEDLPNRLDVDVSEIEVNESIHLEELAKKFEGSKIEFIYEANVALVAVVPPEEEKVVTPVAADAAAAGATPAAGAAGAAAAGAAPAAAAGAAPAAAAGDKKDKGGK